MKMNCGHRYIPICRIAKAILVFTFISVITLFSATMDVDNKNTSLNLSWRLDSADLEAFLNTGSFDNENVTSIYFEGRYYPYYSVILENQSSDIVPRLSVKNSQVVQLPVLSENLDDIPTHAVDNVDVLTFRDHIQVQNIPGIGTLVEIMPLLPLEGGRVKCLNNAEIQIFSASGTLRFANDLNRELSQLSKINLRQELAQDYCVIYFSEPGVYRISGQDLIDKNVDIAGISPDQIKLHRWGREIPCYVSSGNNKGTEIFTETDIVQFYIPELENPYGDYKYNPFSDYDALIMSWGEGNGKRYIQENSDFSDDPNKFTYDMNRKFRSTIHVEENQTVQPLARLHEDELSHLLEHRFYSPSIKVGRSIRYPFEIFDPVNDSPYDVEYRIRMQGLTYSVDDEMDHQIIVKVNNVEAFSDEWEGQQPRISDNEGLQYSHSYLNDGENEFEISVRGFGDDSFLDDQVLLDWFEVSYDRYMIAHNNRLKFSPQHGAGTYMFQVKGLSSPQDIMILKNGTNWIRGYLVNEEDAEGAEKTYTIYFEDQCNGNEEYLVVGPGKEDDISYGVATIDSFRYVNTLENELYNSSDQGDYLIITHKEFYEKSKDLAAHKQSIGYDPAIYELERIYDEYNYGNESPYAIKNFLKDAYYNWSIKPEYVLLVGDVGTKNSVPVIYYQSVGDRGAVIAESWYADLDDDFMLDFSLGRLPISNTEELDSTIKKIKAYDNMVFPRQMNRVVTLTGTGSVFRSQAQDYINTISPDYLQNDRLYLYNSGVSGDFDQGVNSTDSLIEYMNDGILCLNYIGHGSGLTWDNHVLPYEAFDDFVSGKPYIINSMTCFSNTFSNNNAIGEQFIRHPRGGVSIFGSTGYGWINSNHFLLKQVMGNMLYKNMSHGKAMQFALANYFFSSYGKNASFIDELDGVNYVKYFRKALFYQFCILGDPSSTFPLLDREESIVISPNRIGSGETLSISSPDNYTHAYVDIVGAKNNDSKYPLKQKVDLELQQGVAQVIMPEIPAGVKSGMVQMTLWDDELNVAVAKENISFGLSHIEALTYYPEQPGLLDDPVRIRIAIDEGSTVDSLELLVYGESSLNTYSSVLKTQEVEDGLYQTENDLVYSAKDKFQPWISDTLASYIYRGNYFAVKTYFNGDSEISQFFTLSPWTQNSADISILDYQIEDGKSKIILLNQADTSSYVKVIINSHNLDQVMVDTVLTHSDVEQYYEPGVDKINSFYFDFLPQFGADSLEIFIEALDVVDLFSVNDTLRIKTDNSCLNFNNGAWQNFDQDTCYLASDLFKALVVDKNHLGSYTINVSKDLDAIELNTYGATQSKTNILDMLSSDETIQIYGIVSLDSLADDEFIAYYNEDSEAFYKATQFQQGAQRIFSIHEAGKYLISGSVDNEAPEIEISINAREILEQAYVSERSDFSLIIKDNYGVNPLKAHRQILLDGEEISEDNVMVVESGHRENLGINFKLDMDPGEHTLQVIAQDLVGNETESDEFDIIYLGESKLIDYGNFPNPFTTRTTFIYELTEQFDDVTIKIFTISGQKIFTMSSTENTNSDIPLYSIGYHEVEWRGKDEFGNAVANGVYFYVIEGQIDGKKVKEKGKIAKLWL